MAERELHDLPLDPEMESRLRSARPQPDNDFVMLLEEGLFADARAPRRERRFAWRPALAAGLAVAALAILTLIFDLAGIGPFSNDSTPVRAGDNCKTVTVTKRERQPVTNANGDVVFKYRDVQRQVQRCDH